MMIKSKNNPLKPEINNIFSFFDGLDVSINLSIITFFSSFFFQTLDIRVSMIIMTSLVLLSFTSRVLDLFFIRILQQTRLANLDVFLYFLPLYLLPILIPLESSIILPVIIFALSRFLIGIFFSLSCRYIKINQEIVDSKAFSTKYWLSYVIGLLLGGVIYLFINEIYSNDELNRWGWKFFYLIMFFGFLFSYLVSRYFLQRKITLFYDSRVNANTQKEKSIFINDLILLIPRCSFIIFSSSTWLPKFGNPENLQFLNYNFLYLFLTILIFIFVNPLANLVGKKKSIIFFNLSVIIISVVCSFISHKSSYSIDFLKFFISLISSFSICCYLMQLETRKIEAKSRFFRFNLILFLISLFTPILFYYFIHFPINYYGVYIFFTLVYFINYISFFYKKNG